MFELKNYLVTEMLKSNPEFFQIFWKFKKIKRLRLKTQIADGGNKNMIADEGINTPQKVLLYKNW